jgi:ABC-2 type transport system ATP-binding protein
VEAICDRVIIINQGKLVADDKLRNLQGLHKGTQLVLVQFKETVDPALLAAIEGVSRVEQLQPSHYRLHTSDGEAARKQVLGIALEKNLNIISLQSESQSLESIFKALTREP